jgi:hypothetical protein
MGMAIALVKDYKRLPQTVAGLHLVAFACLPSTERAISVVIGPSPQHALRAKGNKVEDIVLLVAEIKAALSSPRPGDLVWVSGG